MTVDPRQPVLVAVGQITHRDGDAPEPVALLAEAARRAVADSGASRLLSAVQSIRVVNLLSRRYPDPGRLVAELLGLDVPHTVTTTMGGNTTQLLVDRACSDIAGGRVDAILIGGAESWRTRSRIKRRGESAPWTVQPDDVQPSERFGAELAMVSAEEDALGLRDPVQAYPMFEIALAARHGRTVAEQVVVASELWARFSTVAARNPHAAIQRAVTAEEIRTPGEGNRMICFPYPKLMTSNASVDQAAALVLMSAERARAIGVPTDRWVFLHGAGEGEDVHFLSERHELATSPAIAAAGAAALELAGITIDDVAHVDLYSCFPSAVQVAAEALGLSLDRDLTVTGGLTFAGGPWNSYVVHSLATMAGVLRAEPDSFGLVSANGGLLTKHAVGVWSCRAPANGTRWRSVQAELDERIPRRVAAPDHDGDAVLETYTVQHDRDGRPERAWLFGLTADGRRTLATTADPPVLQALETEDLVGRAVRVRAGALVAVH